MLRDLFLDGMSRAAATVSIVTTDGSAGRGGVTVSAMSSVSADTATPSLLVCVSERSATGGVIRKNRVFCVNVLGRDQAGTADRFAGRVALGAGDKFEGVEWLRLATGAPALVGAVVAFDCHLRQEMLYGTHWILIGEVAEVALGEGGAAPLLYRNRAYGQPVPLDGAALDARIG